MKFVPPDLRARENEFKWQEDPIEIQQTRKSGKWLKVEIIAVKGPVAFVKTGAATFQANMSKLPRPLDTVDRKNFRTRVSEQEHLCCGSLVKVEWLFGSCSTTTQI